MKIAVISPSNIYCMPYYYKYEKIIGETNNHYDLIFWDRIGLEERTASFVRQIKFTKKTTYNDKRKSKIFKFFAFASFVKKTLKRNKYNRVIFLGTYSLLTFFLTDFLATRYKKNYLLDIRDYTYEKKKWFYNKEKKLISNAYDVFISSYGYKEFLPPYPYHFFHNVDYEVINEYFNKSARDVLSSAIRISFIGNVRYLSENIKFINRFKNDDRFVLQYFGSGSNIIRDFCQKNNITNVKFLDRFNHNDTWKLYRETDAINNLYGNSGIELTTALSNKLYFAASFDKPILVCQNTFMEKISCSYGFGYSVDYTKTNLADDFYEWYQIYKQKNNKGNEFMDIVSKEEKEAICIIKKYLS